MIIVFFRVFTEIQYLQKQQTTDQTKDENVSSNILDVLLPDLENQKEASAQLRTKVLSKTYFVQETS